MTDRTDFADRLAARLLGVDVDADEALIRGQFRRRARAVHPDTSVAVACVDLGRLVEARDRLVARAERRSERVERAHRERLAEAEDLLERLRATTVETAEDVDAGPSGTTDGRRAGAPFVDLADRSGSAAFRAAYQSIDRRGLRIDLAG